MAKTRHGIPLKEGVEVAELKYYDKQGFMAHQTELYYEKNPEYRYVLQMGDWIHELDENGGIKESYHVKPTDAEQQHLDNNMYNFIQKGI